MATPERTRYTPHWYLKAKCKDADPAIFEPSPSVQRKHGAGPKALAFCNQCPVYYDCAHAGLNSNDDGTYAGMTKLDRDRLKAKARASQYATPELTKQLLTAISPRCNRCRNFRRSVNEGICYPCKLVMQREERERKERAARLRARREAAKAREQKAREKKEKAS